MISHLFAPPSLRFFWPWVGGAGLDRFFSDMFDTPPSVIFLLIHLLAFEGGFSFGKGEVRRGVAIRILHKHTFSPRLSLDDFEVFLHVLFFLYNYLLV